MTFKFLSSVVSLALLGSLPALGLAAIGASVQVAQAEPSKSSTSTDVYEMCHQQANAVVTLYSGTEIGTGSIVSQNGLIITNYHVVQEAVQSKGKTKIYVKFQNGDRYLGQVLKPSDQKNDLAVVKLVSTATFRDTISLAQRDELAHIRSGDPVCAIGNPFGMTSITNGEIQGTRDSNDLESAIPLIRGNSGGPLLNAQGKMIGVNKSILLSETGELKNISFATNSDVAQRLLDSVQKSLASAKAATTDGKLPPSDSSLQLANRPVASGGGLGAIIDPKSFTIRQIVLGSLADTNKERPLRPNDRITAINDKPLKKIADLQAELNRHPALIKVTFERGKTTYQTIFYLTQTNSGASH